MASTMVIICRVCCSSLTSTHCVSLFSKKAIDSDLPERLSKALDLPVARNDVLSNYMCRTCDKRFLAVESFRSIAKCSYDKYSKPIHSPKAFRIPIKRTKDTSGPGASPHTVRVRPVAKRLTCGVPGR